MAINYISFPEISEQLIKRFWAKVCITSDIDKCWLWQGTFSEKNYGIFYFDYKRFRANRAAYFIYYKVEPKDLDVLHKCDNPPCVNPHHLFLGTNAENHLDKLNKGRHAKGSDYLRSKLSVEKAAEIRRLYASGKFSQQQLADKFNVHRGSILQVLRNQTWKHG